MKYEDKIAMQAEAHLMHPAADYFSQAPLLSILGCRHIQKPLFGPPMLTKPPQPDPRHEVLTSNTLLSLMRYHVWRTEANEAEPNLEDSLGILDGLLREDRWRSCLQNDADSYSLVWLLVALTSSKYAHTSKDSVALATLVQIDVCNILNGCLKPIAPFSAPLETEHLLRGLFGDPWFDLVYPLAQAPRILPWQLLATAIGQMRPSFLPGLWPDQPSQLALDLPSLETV